MQLVMLCQSNATQAQQVGKTVRNVALTAVNIEGNPNADKFEGGQGAAQVNLGNVTAAIAGDLAPGVLYKVTVEPYVPNQP